MDSKLMFKIFLILAAGLALVCIVTTYCKDIKPAGVPEKFEVYKGDFDPAMAQAVSMPGITAAEEDIQDLPAPVQVPEYAPGQGGVTKPSDLLPVLGNTPEEQKFAQLYTAGQGDVQGLNFLDAGSQIGLSTRLNRNANLQLRSDPPIEKQPLPFLYSTIEADKLRLPFEIGSQSTAVPVGSAEF